MAYIQSVCGGVRRGVCGVCVCVGGCGVGVCVGVCVCACVCKYLKMRTCVCVHTKGNEDTNPNEDVLVFLLCPGDRK